jgi:DNA-binding response OmpR family regulator
MPKTILAVDYDHKTLEEIQSFFEGQNVYFLVAHDGSQALEVYKSQKPDLVLTSALLPKLNGFELCKKITGGELGEVRPVIMFSGIYKAEKYRREAIVGCGAVDFLEKPLVQAHVLKVIRNLFTGIPSVQTPPPLEVIVPSAPTASDGVTLQRLSAVASESADLLEVDDIFDATPAVIGGESALASEPLVLEPLVAESRPLLIPPESKDEIDAAVDGFLIDSDKELQVRDQQIVQEIERELAFSGQSILEIDPMLGPVISPVVGKEADDEIIEIEEPAPVRQEVDQELVLKPATVLEPGDGGKPGKSSASAPEFSFSQPSQRNWVPIVVIALMVLSALFLYWLFAR